MKQAYKKRPPRATANSPPTLPADGQKLFYKSGKFKAQTGGVRHIMHAKIQLKQKYKH